jgi:hypothetical protein
MLIVPALLLASDSLSSVSPIAAPAALNRDQQDREARRHQPAEEGGADIKAAVFAALAGACLLELLLGCRRSLTLGLALGLQHSDLLAPHLARAAVGLTLLVPATSGGHSVLLSPARRQA